MGDESSNKEKGDKEKLQDKIVDDVANEEVTW
jgi:hypothetical protein